MPASASCINNLTNYQVRPLTPADQKFLWEMLYQSLYAPQGSEPFARSVVNQPELARYVKDWGRTGDDGFVAVDENNQPIGAVWSRLFTDEEKGFGYIDERTPELGITVLPEYRGQGIGTDLLSRLLEAAASSYESLSLSVSAENPAVRLYQRLGFEAVAKSGDSITMKSKLKLR